MPKSMQPTARRKSSSSQRSVRPQQVDDMKPNPENGRFVLVVKNIAPVTAL
jgi:hypothetical protein